MLSILTALFHRRTAAAPGQAETTKSRPIARPTPLPVLPAELVALIVAHAVLAAQADLEYANLALVSRTWAALVRAERWRVIVLAAEASWPRSAITSGDDGSPDVLALVRRLFLLRPDEDLVTVRRFLSGCSKLRFLLMSRSAWTAEVLEDAAGGPAWTGELEHLVLDADEADGELGALVLAALARMPRLRGLAFFLRGDRADPLDGDGPRPAPPPAPDPGQLVQVVELAHVAARPQTWLLDRLDAVALRSLDCTLHAARVPVELVAFTRFTSLAKLDLTLLPPGPASSFDPSPAVLALAAHVPSLTTLRTLMIRLAEQPTSLCGVLPAPVTRTFLAALPRSVEHVFLEPPTAGGWTDELWSGFLREREVAGPLGGRSRLRQVDRFEVLIEDEKSEGERREGARRATTAVVEDGRWQALYPPDPRPTELRA
ncbi:hypothetical protein JCM9279_004894 [Rhodotorula babjevae]